METIKFTAADFNSSMGMLTLVWGPPTWLMLHTISFNYPVKPTKEQKKEYYHFVANLTNVLPCKACRDNLTKNLTEMKFSVDHMENRETFSRFIYNLHNRVNVALGKPRYLTYAKVRAQYELFRAKCVKETPLIPKYEKGCIMPVNGVKAKSTINIVPSTYNVETLNIDEKCIPKTKKKV